MSTASLRRLLHPDAVLYPEGSQLPQIPVVEHFAGTEKTMRKALALQAELGAIFDITFDCEDGASAGSEREHAEMIAALIMSAENRFNRIGARIHDSTHTAWRTDLEQIVSLAGTRLAYLVLPKARSTSDVKHTIAALREIESSNKLKRKIPLHVLIETHGALHQVWDIAALPNVETLDFGLMDFVSAHHGAIGSNAMHSPGQFEHPLIVSAKTRIVSAALAHGVLPSHNVCTELVGTKTIKNDAYRARNECGFLRMWSIHPNQIEPILQGMQPAESEINIAAEIIMAAQESNWGPIRHQNRLHDRASYRYYWSILKQAHSTGITLQAEVLNRFFY